MAKMGKLADVMAAMRDTDYTEEQMLAVVNATNRKICYYPEIADKIGTDAAAFLTQMEWRWLHNGKANFYKYIDKNSSGKAGDSWVEELGTTISSFRSTLKIVATRVKGPTAAKKLLETGTEAEHIVVYYLPRNGAMRWYFNEKLFLKLRTGLLANWGGADLRKVKVGQSEENEGPYSEQTQNKENNSEIFSKLESDEWEDPRDEKKRQKNKEKANKERYRPDPELITNLRDGSPMPLDFSVDASTMAQAIEKYKDEEWVENQEILFIEKYTNSVPDFTVVDWNKRFLHQWLVKGWEYKLADEKKYGKSRTTKSAGAARVEGLRELANPDTSAGVGEASYAELAESVERYYDSLDDGDSG